MKICIPTIEQNPNLYSKVARCPLEANGFIVFDTSNQAEISLSRSNLNLSSSGEFLHELNKRYEINSFVANSYCKEIYEESKSKKVDMWQCNALTVVDTINIFRLGGSFLYNLKQLVEINHQLN